jgi:hypothetical protein
LKYYLRKSSDDNCLQKPINQGKIHIFHTIFFSTGFRPLLSKIGSRTAVKLSRPIIFLFGRFCVILQNFRPAGNSGEELDDFLRQNQLLYICNCETVHACWDSVHIILERLFHGLLCNIFLAKNGDRDDGFPFLYMVFDNYGAPDRMLNSAGRLISSATAD